MHSVEILSQRQEDINGVSVLILKVSMDGRQANVHIPSAAIENRKQVYRLATDDAAIEAILKEHATMELRLEPDSKTKDRRLGARGGLRRDVTVSRATP